MLCEGRRYSTAVLTANEKTDIEHVLRKGNAISHNNMQIPHWPHQY